MATTTATTADAPAHEHAHHPPHLQHHFVSSEQQFDSAKLGMWLFLITEILLFSGMFVAYTVYRVWHPETFTAASAFLDWRLGGLNTLVLLFSSYTVALSIHYAQKDRLDRTFWMLVITLACAGVFMIVKAFEYGGKFAEGVFPGEAFDPVGHYAPLADIPYARQFFSIYFVMTGIHGFHVLVGMGIFLWLLFRVRRGDFNSEYYTHIELAGLYWHLVDIIWIFLFPLLYLIGHGGGGH